jgi:hypothetical protein
MSSELIQIRDFDDKFNKQSVFAYDPISVKDEMNPPTSNSFDKMTNGQLFLSRKNVYYMCYTFRSLNKASRSTVDINKLQEFIPRRMSEWALSKRIDNITYATGDIIQNLGFINNQFISDHDFLYDCSGNNTCKAFRVKSRVTDKCGRESTKKYDEMLATDYHTLNLWRDDAKDVYIYNQVSRDDNKIPVWQKSMNTRHYDRANDGFSCSVPERSSLDTQSRGYDMSNIIKGSTNY